MSNSHIQNAEARNSSGCAKVVWALILAMVSITSWAQTAEPSAFQLFRWEEDYRGLASSALEGEHSLKYVPFGSSSWASFGGEVRGRIEHASGPSLGLGGSADNYSLQRVLTHADLHSGSTARAFIEVGAYFASDKKTKSPPAVDQLDIQQAFVDLPVPFMGRGTTTLRAGRQEMAFGSQRLIGIRDGPNVRRNYDGLRVSQRVGATRIDVIAVRPVELKQGAFDNRTSDTEALWGLYLTAPFGSVSTFVDLYALGYERSRATFASASGQERRQSFGARLFGKASGWDWDIEGTVQTGSIAEQSIFAWGLASDFGYRMLIDTFEVRAGLRLDYASGDDDPHDNRLGTGNALHPRLPYLGSAGAFAPSNLIDFHPNVTFKPDERLTITLGYQLIWRASTRDAVYVAPLVPFPDTAGRSGRFTAQQWPLDVGWQVNRNFRVDASLARVEVSDRLRASGADNVTFAFISGAYRF